MNQIKNKGKKLREKKREEKNLKEKEINPIDFETMTKKTFPVLDNTLPLDQNPPFCDGYKL